MIAHRQERRKDTPDNYERLATYVLDVQGRADPTLNNRTDSYERLGNYIIDQANGGERVVGACATNCDTEDLGEAIALIAATQACNVRSKTDKSYHLIISFPEGERPTIEQLRHIEDRLVEAIGFKDHQRISAIHDDTDNLHIHVAINKVHPQTHRNVEPYYDKAKLMAACVELEIEHGLIRDNHGIGERLRLPQGANRMENFAGEESLLRWVFENAAPDLIDAGSTVSSWQELHKVFDDYGLTIKPRGAGLVIMAQSDGTMIKASSVSRLLAFKALTDRLGEYDAPAKTSEPPKAAESDGQRAQDDEAPTTSSAEREEDASGKPIGGDGPTRRPRYERGPLDRADSSELYARYKLERDRASGERQTALDRHTERVAAGAKILQQAHAARALEIRSDVYGRGDEKKKAWSQLSRTRKDDWAKHRAEAKRTRAEVIRDRPLPTWQSFLEREAAAGDVAALAALRAKASVRTRLASSVLTASDIARARDIVFKSMKPAARANGDMLYRLKDGGAVTDRKHEVRVETLTTSSAFVALTLAMERFAGQALMLNGAEDFKAAVVQVAALRGLDVQFADPAMEIARKAAIAGLDRHTSPAATPLDAYIASRNRLAERIPDVPQHRLWKSEDAGVLEYAGRRKFSDGQEALLFRSGGIVVVKAASTIQAAMASRWQVGQAIQVDATGRVSDPARARGE